MEISLQKRWAIAIYKELNTSKLEDCISRLSTALEKFKVYIYLWYNVTLYKYVSHSLAS